MRRILVIDDDVTHAELMRVVLEDAAFEVSVASSPAELPSGRFDCVITDLVTVGMYDVNDARDWVLSLRDRYAEVPIIVTTAHPEARADEELIGARIVVKPFDIEELTQTVRRVTCGRGPTS